MSADLHLVTPEENAQADPSAWSDQDLWASIEGCSREMQQLGVIKVEMDPIKGPHLDALTDLLVGAGIIDNDALHHRMLVRYLIELRRNIEELRRQRLTSGGKPGGLFMPKK